jgi:hypothetical protein
MIGSSARCMGSCHAYCARFSCHCLLTPYFLPVAGFADAGRGSCRVVQVAATRVCLHPLVCACIHSGLGLLGHSHTQAHDTLRQLVGRACLHCFKSGSHTDCFSTWVAAVSCCASKQGQVWSMFGAGVPAGQRPEVCILLLVAGNCSGRSCSWLPDVAASQPACHSTLAGTGATPPFGWCTFICLCPQLWLASQYMELIPPHMQPCCFPVLPMPIQVRFKLGLMPCAPVL